MNNKWAQRPVKTTRIPRGPGWIHEIKRDGFRCRMTNRDGLELLSRGGEVLDLDGPFLPDASKLPRLVLDGELVALVNGRDSLTRLQSSTKENPGDLRFFAFDILEVGGVDLRARPLSERKEVLHGLFAIVPDLERVSLVDHTTDGLALFNLVKLHDLEGIVSKLLSSIYDAGRHTTWLKAKPHYITTTN